jgi:hypothetical protein
MDPNKKRQIVVSRQRERNVINRGFNPPSIHVASVEAQSKQQEQIMQNIFSPLKPHRQREIVKQWENITGKSVIFISFVSDPIGSNFYSSRVPSLLSKLVDLGYDYIIRQYPSDRHYFQNCCFKPVFIKEIMEKYDKNLVWIDGDTNLKKSLDLFTLDQDYDVGLVSYTHDISSFVASPIFFRNTPQSKALIESWESHCTSQIENGICELDHDAIKHSIIPQFRSSLRIKLNNKDYHNGEVLENVNSDVPEKRRVLQEMVPINARRPFNLTNKDFIIV